MQRVEESLEPPFSALQKNPRGELLLLHNVTAERFVRAKTLYRISSSQERQKTNTVFHSDLKNSTASPLPWALL